ncbi:MAG: sigma 54-interacting transcriptional regulator [Sandaracinaceae bacterium]|nr:sigma 54-interacting transcriptional regulator [Sandaracinaceae bacterium]
MADLRTTPHDSGAIAPVRSLRVEVVHGPDVGRTAWSEEDRLAVGSAKDNDLVLHDPTVSRYHLELVRDREGIRLVDPGSTNGTRFAGVRVERAVVPAGTEIEIGATRLRIGEGTEVEVEIHEETRLGDLVGASEPMRRVMAWIKRAAKSDVPVLVTGESGTGKELVARGIHERSARAAEPFVTVDCGALAPSLVASELFGHERGAFTGAERARAGALERANGGTLFLDEIGELPLELQPNLLGALERQRFRRVGGSDEIAVDVRIVSATNRDLRNEINAGAFRLDLFYRVAVLKMTLPALRERPQDIPQLVRHFLQELDAETSAAHLFDDATLQALAALAWPGNVRELRNMVMASVALEELPPLEEGRGAPSQPPGVEPFADLTGQPFKRARQAALGRFERVYLKALLERTGDNVSAAARDAGLDRSYFFSLLKKHGLR